jgi:hypothetical protein
MAELYSSFEEAMEAIHDAEGPDAFTRSLATIKKSIKVGMFVLTESDEAQLSTLLASRIVSDKRLKPMLN